MDKKDIIFLATALVAAPRFKEFQPSSDRDTNQPSHDFFVSWYRHLSDLYDECEKNSQKK